MCIRDSYRTLEPGAVLEAGGRRLTCLPAPGHTPGQLCFWDESDGILFTGDHVLFDISPNITPWNGMEDCLLYTSELSSSGGAEE